ncbi:hypothetical protein [uncultured Shewanella sp.]|uniref:hypothetical protein n=1 Tax=uncultured Shewanella sp. TaxID=173975 RepID=UPI00261B3E13|nr:hypothetical protein [uncultured Shewanella sp.]
MEMVIAEGYVAYNDLVTGDSLKSTAFDDHVELSFNGGEIVLLVNNETITIRDNISRVEFVTKNTMPEPLVLASVSKAAKSNIAPPSNKLSPPEPVNRIYAGLKDEFTSEPLSNGRHELRVKVHADGLPPKPIEMLRSGTDLFLSKSPWSRDEGHYRDALERTKDNIERKCEIERQNAMNAAARVSFVEEAVDEAMAYLANKVVSYTPLKLPKDVVKAAVMFNVLSLEEGPLCQGTLVGDGARWSMEQIHPYLLKLKNIFETYNEEVPVTFEYRIIKEPGSASESFSPPFTSFGPWTAVNREYIHHYNTAAYTTHEVPVPANKEGLYIRAPLEVEGTIDGVRNSANTMQVEVSNNPDFKPRQPGSEPASDLKLTFKSVEVIGSDGSILSDKHYEPIPIFGGDIDKDGYVKLQLEKGKYGWRDMIILEPANPAENKHDMAATSVEVSYFRMESKCPEFTHIASKEMNYADAVMYCAGMGSTLPTLNKLNSIANATHEACDWPKTHLWTSDMSSSEFAYAHNTAMSAMSTVWATNREFEVVCLAGN